MVPVLGRIDDVLVLVAALALFLGTAPKHLASEHGGGRPGADGEVIDGSYRFIDDKDE